MLGLGRGQRALRPAGRSRASARRPVRGTRPRPRARREPAPGRPSAPARRRRPRRARSPRGRGARRGDRDRRRHRWPPRARDARSGAPPATRPGRPQSAPADGGSAPATPNSTSPAASAGGAASSPMPSSLGRTPQQHRIADRLRRRDQQQPPRLRRQRRQPAPEAFLDAARQRGGVGQPEPARQLRRRQPARQLQQCERVAARLGHDPIAYPLVERPGDHRRPAAPGHRRRPARGPPVPPCPPARARRASPRTANTTATDSATRRRATNASTCAEALSSHCASSTTQTSGSFVGHIGQQAQDRQADEEAIRRAPALQAECRAEGVALRRGKPLEPVQHRRAELMQPGVRELHLGLDARRQRDTTARRAFEQVLQQRGLPDPGLAAQDQHRACARAQLLQQPIQHPALAAPTPQPWP